MQTVSDVLDVEVIPVTMFQQNCSLLRDRTTGKAAVVDPGGELERIRAAIDAAGAEVESILLTHGHADHAGATTALARALDVPVIGPHEEDRFLLDSLPVQSAAFGLEPAERCEPDRWLQGGDRVHVGELELEVLHCPGHTPGHIVFFQRASSFCVVGDVLFSGSIGRTDFPKGDHATLIRSILEELIPLGDDVTFLPGHGPTSTLGHERLTNPFLT